MRPSEASIPRRTLLAFAFALGALAPATAGAVVDGRPLIIGTGPVTGHDYAVGGAVARLVTASVPEGGFRLGVETTNGGAETLVRVADGDLDLGIASSDQVFAAYHGFGQFEGERRLIGLRTLASLQHEPLVVVARAETGAEALDDLRGGRFNLGVPGTAMHGLITNVLEAFDWGEDDLAHTDLRPIRTQLDALCADRLDAIAFTAASPSGSVAQALSACDTVLVEIAGAPLERLLTERPYLSTALTPAADYPQLSRDIPSVGPVATLVASQALDAEDAYRIIAALAENAEALAAMHPALSDLTVDALLSDRLAAPLHDGVQRYLEDSGRQ